MQQIIKSSINEIRPDIDISDTNLLTQIDSIDIANLIALLEERFLIEIPPLDILPENFESVIAIENFIKSLKEKQQ